MGSIKTDREVYFRSRKAAEAYRINHHDIPTGMKTKEQMEMETLDRIDIKTIEKYLRKKKLENLNN
jgi:hypothetical protein